MSKLKNACCLFGRRKYDGNDQPRTQSDIFFFVNLINCLDMRHKQ